MRITKLSLANFRSFGKEQTIEFAPVTLLFGPNSVGKSTALMALFYVQQILKDGQCSPQRLYAMGNRFVGGFKHLVYGKDVSNSIKISIEYDKGDRIGNDYSELTEYVGHDVDTLFMLPSSPASDARKMGVELEISWSESNHDAYVSRYRVLFDEEPVAEVSSDSGQKQPLVTEINYLHPLLVPIDHDEWLKDEIEHGGEVHSANYEKAKDLSLEVEAGEEDVFDVSDFATATEFHRLLYRPSLDNTNWEDVAAVGSLSNWHYSHTPVAIRGRSGALPRLGRRVETNDLAEQPNLDIVLKEVLSDVLVAPLDNLLEILNESLCIGPLRQISDATYQSNAYPQQGDWYNGKACWDELATPNIVRDVTINHWLSVRDKLNLGYKLVYKTSEGNARYISPTDKIENLDDLLAISDVLGSQIKTTYSEKDLAENPQADQTPIDPEVWEILRKSQELKSPLYLGEFPFKESSVALWDCQNNIEVTAADIGVGVSQILPLLVAATIVEKGLIACEQPELHVHPRVQVAIGDMLLQTSDDTNFLIETHSEHLVLRLLRRIRESSGATQPEGMEPVLPGDVSVIYLEPSEEGVRVSRLEITDDGDFEEHWPGGFFEERDEELF